MAFVEEVLTGPPPPYPFTVGLLPNRLSALETLQIIASGGESVYIGAQRESRMDISDYLSAVNRSRPIKGLSQEGKTFKPMTDY